MCYLVWYKYVTAMVKHNNFTVFHTFPSLRLHLWDYEQGTSKDVKLSLFFNVSYPSNMFSFSFLRKVVVR